MQAPMAVLAGMWEEAGWRNWSADLSWHLAHGCVYATPEVFVMARAVRWEDGMEAVLRIDRPQRPWEECDTWFIWAAAGEGAVARGMEVAPQQLPWVAWHRRGTILHRWRWNRLARLALSANAAGQSARNA